MADRLRIVTFSAGGRPQTVIDLNDGTNVTLIRDTLKVTPPQSTQQLADSQRRYGGGYIAAETHSNGSFEAEWYVTDTTADAQLVRLEALLGILQQPARNRYVEWRPEGATRSVFYEIRGPGQWEPTYRWIVYQQSKTIQLKAALVVAPLAEGSRLDIWDDFAVDSIADYAFDAGSGTVSVSGGELVPSSTAQKDFYHNERGYTYEDVQVTARHFVGTVTTAHRAGVMVKRLDVSNQIRAICSFATNLIIVQKIDAGVATTLASTAITGAAANTNYWVRGRIEGNVVTAEHYTTAPSPGIAPANVATYTLTGADATKFGKGVSGYTGIAGWTPADTTGRIDDFTVEPYTYTSRTAGEEIDLPSIPGTAPAKVGIYTSQTAGSTYTPWAAFGWQPKPSPFNYVQRGDFENQTGATAIYGWSNAAVTNINGASTSVAQYTTQGKFGSFALQTVCPATADTGANYQIFRLFKKGVTYTATAWIRAAAGTTNTYIRLGYGPTPDVATSGNTALSTAWQQISVTWTPTADRPYAHVALNIAAAAATTFQIDGVQVYEGTTAPTAGRHAEGWGAHAPIGYINAPQTAIAPTGTPTAWSTSTDTQHRSGNKLTVNTTPNVAGNVYSEYFIDSSLLTGADSFASGEYFFEVWASAGVGNAGGAVRATASLRPESVGGVGNAGTRYSLEFGAAGKSIASIGVSDPRLVRLGTFSIPVDPANNPRWVLGVNWAYPATAGGVTLTFDHLVLLPVRRRAASPSGKANDSSYPLFSQSTTNAKFITYDLQGFQSTPSLLAWLPGYPAAKTTGLSGTLIEPDPGPARFVTRLSREVADLVVPSGSGASGAELTGSGDTSRFYHHFVVQPRYFLGRGA